MLTNEQVESLFTFCEKKGVRYYDLQVELVDHLAASIEARMAANPTFSFEEALKEVYSGFGIFGFSHVVQDRENAARKMYRKKAWKYFKSYLSYPKIAITIIVALLFNALFYFLPVEYRSNYYLGLMILAVVTSAIFSIWCLKKFPKPQKKLTINFNEFYWGVTALLWSLPNLYFNVLLNGFEVDVNSLWTQLVMTLFCTLVFIGCLAKYQAWKKMYQELQFQYPLAFKAG